MASLGIVCADFLVSHKMPTIGVRIVENVEVRGAPGPVTSYFMLCV